MVAKTKVKSVKNKLHSQLSVHDVPQVGVIMGSQSDWPTLQESCEVLAHLQISFEVRVLSAHRTPLAMIQYAQKASQRGIQVIIAGAGGAAHLPGMVAANTLVPVVGVPVVTKNMNGLDSLYSIVQMPFPVPVATMAIGGAKNAAIFAARIIALNSPKIAESLDVLVRVNSQLAVDSDRKLFAQSQKFTATQE